MPYHHKHILKYGLKQFYLNRLDLCTYTEDIILVAEDPTLKVRDSRDHYKALKKSH